MSVSTTRSGSGDAIPAYQVVLAGALAGLTARFVIAPLDVAKIRLQLQAHSRSDPITTPPSTTTARTTIHAHPARPVLYKGTVGTLVQIAKSEGLTALWKGNVPAECLYLAYGGIQFIVYQHVSLDILDSNPTTSSWNKPTKSFIAGACAGVIATGSTYPFDLLRTRLAAQGETNRAYPSLRAAVSRIYRSEGPSGFFRGLGAGLAQIVPHMGLFFGLYEIVKPNMDKTLSHLPDSIRMLGAPDAIAGIIASVAAKTVVYPLDTVRRRLQVQGPDRTRYVHGDAIPAYGGGRSAVTMFKSVWAHEGVKSLYRGLCVSLIKAAPASAVTIWMYERTIAVFRMMEVDR